MMSRTSFSRALILLWLLALPAWAAGALRTSRHWSLTSSYLIAALVAAGAIAWLLRGIRRVSFRDEAWALGLGALFSAMALAVLYNGDFYGAPMFSGIPDASHHLQNALGFAGPGPGVYEGC